MRKFQLVAFVLFLGGFSGISSAGITLKDVFQGSPKIANFKNSRYTAAISEADKFIKINDDLYEVRYFMFQRNDGKTQTFKEFAQERSLDSGAAKELDRGFGPLIVFMPSKEMEQEGFHYILSLAKRSEEDVQAWKKLPDDSK